MNDEFDNYALLRGCTHRQRYNGTNEGYYGYIDGNAFVNVFCINLDSLGVVDDFGGTPFKESLHNMLPPPEPIELPP